MHLTRQRRVGALPLGAHHPRRRRCSAATAASPAPSEDVWDHADLDEVRRECRAQIERAILWGFDVSHLDAHMATLQFRPEFFDVYLDLAVEFRLPLRMVGPPDGGVPGLPGPRAWPRTPGRSSPTELLFVPGRRARRAMFEQHLRPPEAGGHRDARSTRRSTAPSCGPSPPDWEARVDDHRLVCDDGRHLAGALEAGRGARWSATARSGDLARRLTWRGGVGRALLGADAGAASSIRWPVRRAPPAGARRQIGVGVVDPR